MVREFFSAPNPFSLPMQQLKEKFTNAATERKVYHCSKRKSLPLQQKFTTVAKEKFHWHPQTNTEQKECLDHRLAHGAVHGAGFYHGLTTTHFPFYVT